MKLKIDTFTWAVIGIVLILMVAAVITVQRSDGNTTNTLTYIEDDTPAAPVQNAFVAFHQGDLLKAKEQFTTDVIEDAGKDSYGPFGGNRMLDERPRRLRIADVQQGADDADEAIVIFELDTYSGGGLFGGGDTWSYRSSVTVIREEGVWKINTPEFFY
ncbi:MAG: hypothetical protein AAF639_20670 [Chloroflexota bacterium]